MSRTKCIFYASAAVILITTAAWGVWMAFIRWCPVPMPFSDFWVLLFMGWLSFVAAGKIFRKGELSRTPWVAAFLISILLLALVVNSEGWNRIPRPSDWYGKQLGAFTEKLNVPNDQAAIHLLLNEIVQVRGESVSAWKVKLHIHANQASWVIWIRSGISYSRYVVDAKTGAITGLD